MWFSVAARVSTVAASASTVTVSCTLPTSSLASTRTFSLACNRIPFCSYLRNPVCSTSRLYEPTGSSVNTKPPLWSVVAVRVRPVAVLVTVTFAPGTVAAWASVTVPNSDAVSRTCAATGESPAASARQSRHKRVFFVIVISFLRDQLHEVDLFGYRPSPQSPSSVKFQWSGYPESESKLQDSGSY